MPSPSLARARRSRTILPACGEEGDRALASFVGRRSWKISVDGSTALVLTGALFAELGSIPVSSFIDRQVRDFSQCVLCVSTIRELRILCAVGWNVTFRSRPSQYRAMGGRRAAMPRRDQPAVDGSTR